jgi:hypothetical protein
MKLRTSHNYKLTPNINNEPMDTSIVVAVIGGCFSVLAALIHRFQKENHKDHGRVHEALGRIEQKIDHHTENHP